MKKWMILLLIVFAAGCAKKQVQMPEQPVVPEEPMVQPDDVDREIVEEIVRPRDEDIRERALSIEEQARSIFKDVLFDYDRYEIRSDARPVLNSVASFLKQNKGVNVVIEGHCDERGTNEYNLALGEKRANATKQYLTSLGVSASRMIVITYGEEKPVCTQHAESCWQLNRRAHFAIVQ